MARLITEPADGLRHEHFARVAGYIEETTGIKLPPEKKTMVEGRLRRRARALGLADINEYCDVLFERDGFASEAVHLIDAVTTNKTDFFREPSHFDFLRDTYLPAIRQGGGGIARPVKFWSAAASIGAEAYSLAMVVQDFAASLAGAEFRYAILATDISTDVLRRGARAVYPAEMIDPIPEEMRRRYLLKSKDASRNLVRIVPQLRQQVTFQHLNLMQQRYPVDRDFDVIFCRNMLIYFDAATQDRVLRRLIDHLRPGGLLFLGHSESLAGTRLSLDFQGDAIFRRT